MQTTTKLSRKSCTFQLDKPGLYESFPYPAGETQVRLTKEGIEAATDADVAIVARITEPFQIVTMALLNSAIKGVGGRTRLILPYLPYGRADRRFQLGDCAGLETFGKLAVHLADHIVTLDAHSIVSEEAVAGLVNVSAESFIHRAILEFADWLHVDKVNVLFPDQGARERYEILQHVGNNRLTVETVIFHASKKRHPSTGIFRGFDVPELPPRPTIIIDDLCDGGGTFLGIADILEMRPGEHHPLGLYVTHGIFSKGIKILLEHYIHIWTTNSFAETHGDPRTDLTVLDCLPALMKAV